MTEAQAYNELGWPHKGRGFILPLSGSEETDWRTYRCVECGLEGVTRIDATCPCNTIMLMPRASIKTTVGAENAVQWILKPEAQSTEHDRN